ncbi:ParB N-terminal domain-containing protein [Candidatus Woesearchaeota archaeon]|nr:ParB N-terminal domain-containing protein [Candidatus Woesearchaeota archaeon]
MVNSDARLDPQSLKPHPRNITIYGEETLDELIEHIQTSGWIKPIVVTRENRIISGHRRWRAALVLKLQTVPVEYRDFSDETAELEALLLENATRSKTIEQKVREAELWKEIEQAKARARQTAFLKHGTHSPVRENFPQREEPGRTRDIVAQRVGFGSGRTYEKASKVVHLIDQARATGNIEHAEALQSILNRQSVDAAARLIEKPEAERRAILDYLAQGTARDVQEAETRLARDAQRAALADMAAKNQPLTGGLGKFNVILADPPWPYNSRAHHKTRFRGGAWGHYPLMTMDAIRELGSTVRELAAEDAVLYLWCTGPLLQEQLTVFESWGFEYVTLGFVWVKLNPKNQRPFHGVGFYTKSNAELCLFGKRGRTLRPATDQVSQIIYPDDGQADSTSSPAILSERREHSRKPDEVYEAVEAMYPDLPKLELFARNPREGWKQWGNQMPR